MGDVTVLFAGREVEVQVEGVGLSRALTYVAQAEAIRDETAELQGQAVAAVEAQEASSLAVLQAQQTTSVAAVQSQQTTSVAAVSSQQTTSVAAVAAQGVTSVAAVEAQEDESVAAVEAAGVALSDNLVTAPDFVVDAIDLAFGVSAGVAGDEGAVGILARNARLVNYDPENDWTELTRTRAEEDDATDSRVREDIDTFDDFNEGVADENQGPSGVLLPDGRGLANPTKYGRLQQINEDGAFELVVLRSEIPGVGAGETFELADCPVIFVNGNSLDEDGYSLAGKSIGNVLSGMTDWRIVNLSWSGHDPVELYQKIQADTLRFNVTPSSLKGAYVLISDLSNAALKQEQLSDYIVALERLIGLWQGMGVEPILMSEPRSAVQAMTVDTTSAPMLIAAQMALAARLGIRYWNRSDYQRAMEAVRYDPYYASNHGGLRAQRMMVDYMAAQIAALPRPSKAIRLYSPRGAPASADDLAFDTIDQMRSLWIPSMVGHTALSTGDQARVDDIDGTTPTLQTINDSAGSVSCTDYGLVRIVMPGTAATIDSVTISGLPTGATIYALSANPALSWDPSTQAVGYQVVECASLPTITAGATYNDGTYDHTVIGTVTTDDGRHLVVTVPGTLRNSGGALTFTKTSGTGDVSFVSTRLRIGEHSDFYASLGLPFRVWTDALAVSGTVTLTDLAGAMVGDVITLLVEQSGAFSLSAPDVSWTGAGGKMDSPLPSGEIWPTGTQLLAEPDVLDSAAGWVSVDAAGTEGATPTSAAPADGWLPVDVTEVVEVTASAGIRQTFTPASDARRNLDLTILAWGRYFPDLQDAGDPFETNGVTLTSLDEVTLRIKLHNGDERLAVVEDVRVGLAWKPAPVRLALPASTQLSGDLTLDIYCIDGTAQIGRVEVWKGA